MRDPGEPTYLPDRGLPRDLARVARLTACASVLIEEVTYALYNALPEDVRLTTAPDSVRESATLAALTTLEVALDHLAVDLDRVDPTLLLGSLWEHVDECDRPVEPPAT